MHNENEIDTFRPETTDIFIDNYEENVPSANASNASISSYVNNIECMETHVGEVKKIQLRIRLNYKQYYPWYKSWM